MPESRRNLPVEKHQNIPKLSLPDDECDDIEHSNEDNKQRFRKTTPSTCESPFALCVPTLSTSASADDLLGQSSESEDEQHLTKLIAIRERGRSYSLPPSILRKQIAQIQNKKHNSESHLDEDDDTGCPYNTGRRVSFSLPDGDVVKGQDENKRRKNDRRLRQGKTTPRGTPLPTGSSTFQMVMNQVDPPSPPMSSPSCSISDEKIPSQRDQNKSLVPYADIKSSKLAKTSGKNMKITPNATQQTHQSVKHTLSPT